MAKFLKPIATVGASVSILFHFANFLVLSCLKKKAFSLRMKQHYSLSLCITYFVAVLGLREDPEQAVCRFVVVLLQYTVTASFAWFAIDSYLLWSNLKRKGNKNSILKYFFLAWLSPLPFLIIGIIIGFLVDDNLGLGYYRCWKSDHVIWMLILPCLSFTILSMKYLIPSLLHVDKSRTNSATNLTTPTKDSLQFILKTNLICLILQVMCWTCGVLVFFFDSEETFHLLFGITSALKAALLFFFYAVSYIEMYMQKSTARREDEGEGYYQAEIELKENSSNHENIADIAQYQRQSMTEKESKEQNIKMTDENHLNRTVERTSEIIDIEKTTPKDTSRSVIENHQTAADVESKNNNIEETTVLVHSPGSTSSLNVEPTTETIPNISSIQNEQVTEVNDDKLNKDEDDFRPSNTRTNSETGSDMESKSVKSTATTLTDVTDLGKNDVYDTMNPPREETPTRCVINTETSPTSEKRQSKPSPRNERSTNQYGSSTKRERDTRPSSRASNISYTSQLGMNELESLFNNPDLLNQANWKARSRSHASPNRMSTTESLHSNNPPTSPTLRPWSSSSSSSTLPQDNQMRQSPMMTEKQPSDPSNRNTESSSASVKRKKRDSRNEFFDFN